MRAAARETLIIILGLVLATGFSFGVSKAAAQSDTYSKMAPIDQYLMERNAEILLARSAAPESISGDATILVLERHGYETAVQGKNAFVCMVERSWMEPFDAPEFWNPKVRGAECLNAPAGRSMLPILHFRTGMVLAGKSKSETVSALKAAYAKKQLPALEAGGMAFMMSKSAYLFDAGDHNGPHVMFYTPLEDGKDWGAWASGSPVFSASQWFLSSNELAQAKGLPPILVFAVAVAKWSDGTVAPVHQE